VGSRRRLAVAIRLGGMADHHCFYHIVVGLNPSDGVEDPVKTALLCVIVGLVALASDSELTLGLAIGVYVGYLGAAQIDRWEGER